MVHFQYSVTGDDFIHMPSPSFPNIERLPWSLSGHEDISLSHAEFSVVSRESTPDFVKLPARRTGGKRRVGRGGQLKCMRCRNAKRGRNVPHEGVHLSNGLVLCRRPLRDRVRYAY